MYDSYLQLFPEVSYDALNIYKIYSISSDPVTKAVSRYVIYIAYIVSSLKVELDLCLVNGLPEDKQQDTRAAILSKQSIAWDVIYEQNNLLIPDEASRLLTELKTWIIFNLNKVDTFLCQSDASTSPEIIDFFQQVFALYARFPISLHERGNNLPNIDFIERFRNPTNELAWCDKLPSLHNIVGWIKSGVLYQQKHDDTGAASNGASQSNAVSNRWLFFQQQDVTDNETLDDIGEEELEDAIRLSNELEKMLDIYEPVT